VSTKPLIISLDVETYGAFSCWDKGSGACPDQTVFNPALSKQIDRVHLPCRLVPQCAVTIVSGEPSDPTGWEPQETAVFDMCTEQHLVLDLVRKADTIIGSNIVYDLSYLREFSGFASWLIEYPLPTLVDTIILSWLHSGARKERSLKALGPALGAFAYDRTLKAGKFPFPMCADAIKYNAQDTHNAVLAARALAQRINDEQGRKLTPSAIMFHSDRLWNILDLSHNGQHFNRYELYCAADNLAHTTAVIGAELYKSEIFPSGEGSGSSQSELIDWSCTTRASSSTPTRSAASETTGRTERSWRPSSGTATPTTRMPSSSSTSRPTPPSTASSRRSARSCPSGSTVATTSTFRPAASPSATRFPATPPGTEPPPTRAACSPCDCHAGDPQPRPGRRTSAN
jgi:hypothetical protein